MPVKRNKGVITMNKLINIAFYTALIASYYVLPYQITENKLFSSIVMTIAIIAIIVDHKRKKVN